MSNTLYRVIDNPEYQDRYTLCFMDEDDKPFVYGASENPFHPMGFGQFCGELYFGEDQDLGTEIDIEDTPEPVQRLAANLSETEEVI